MDSEEITEKLNSLECPINWHLEAINKGNAAKKLLQKSDSRSEENDASATWSEISLVLCLAYLEFLNEIPDMQENKMTEHLKRAEEMCEQRKDIHTFIKDYSPAVNYVVRAMWAHFYHKYNNTEEVKKLLNLIAPFDKLRAKERAGILAIKSCCFMAFGPYDSSEALQAIEQAVQLDGDEAEWNFLKGKCLARTRRCLNFRSSPTDEELKCLKIAADKDTRSPQHYVFCALSFQERGLNDTSAEKKKYMDESYKLFKQAAAYSFDSPTSLARIARGLMRTLHLGGPPLEALVENCVKRSCELCPDSGLVNHVAANFYFKTARGKKKNLEKCVFYLKKAAFESGVYGAYMNLFDMYNSNKTLVDIEVAAKNFWQEFNEIPVDRFKALKPMTAYYFFVKKDNIQAMKLWKEWLQSPRNTHKDPKNPFFVKCDNLTEAICDKVRKVLENSTLCTPAEEEEIRLFLSIPEISEQR